MNIHWPYSSHNGMSPWYLIVWRLLLMPLLLITWVVKMLCILLGWGKDGFIEVYFRGPIN